MPAVPDVDSGRASPARAPQIFPRPLLSSRPHGWDHIVVEVYRARDVDFVATHAEHVVSLQLRGSIDPLRQTGATGSRKATRIGNINITPAGVARHWRHDGVTELLVVRVAPSVVEAVTSVDDGSDGSDGSDGDRVELVAHSGIRDAQIEYLGARFLDELKAGGLASRKYVQLLVNLLAIHLVRHYSTARGSPGDPSAKLARHKLRQATDYIQENLRNDLSLGKISEALCMSPCHFAHVFKQTTGLAPHRYVIESRIERAKSLLRETSLPVNEIAQMVGYSNQSHFSTVFRQFIGQSPLRYRRDA